MDKQTTKNADKRGGMKNTFGSLMYDGFMATSSAATQLTDNDLQAGIDPSGMVFRFIGQGEFSDFNLSDRVQMPLLRNRFRYPHSTANTQTELDYALDQYVLNTVRFELVRSCKAQNRNAVPHDTNRESE